MIGISSWEQRIRNESGTQRLHFDNPFPWGELEHVGLSCGFSRLEPRWNSQREKERKHDETPAPVPLDHSPQLSYQRRRRAEGNTLMMTMLRFQQTRKTQTGRAGGDTEEGDETATTNTSTITIAATPDGTSIYIRSISIPPSPQLDSRRMGNQHVAARFMSTKSSNFQRRLRAHITHPNLRMDGKGRICLRLTMRNNRLGFSSRYTHDGTHVRGVRTGVDASVGRDF